MDAVRLDPEYIDLCRTPAFEGVYYSNLTFDRLFQGLSDLRESIPALKDHRLQVRPEDVVVDSDMSLHQAFQNLSAHCPDEVLAKQQLLRVFYFGADGAVHQGQVVAHEAIAQDVSDLFTMILKEQIPIGSVRPISDPRYDDKGVWSDYLSMDHNNSSAFNYRKVINPDGQKSRLSLHALGLALDINPLWNPCYGTPLTHNLSDFSAEAAAGYQAVLPKGGQYDLAHAGSFHNRHPVVLFLKERGWIWGGEWGNPKDLHHFQKVPAQIKEDVDRLRDA